MSLNATPTQQRAINHIEGPMRVLAGPGTGKTEILALRIANLLQSDAQIDAQNILCITYTDAGRNNMRDRLAQKIGAEVAHKIAIHTFHSFCAEVIRQNEKYFAKDELSLVSELEQIQFVTEILDNLPKQHLLYNPKSQYTKIKPLLELFRVIKEEGLVRDDIFESIDEFISYELEKNAEKYYYQKNYKDKKAGEPKDALQKLYDKMATLKEAIDLYPQYQKKFATHARYDFADMIQWVVTLFEHQPEILFNYAEKYQFILVDEYQDTNGAQNKLIKLLADCAPDNCPNLFVVGDDDQSIYRFQGASSANMRMIEKAYGDQLAEVQLTENFRSSQAILDFAEAFIKRNTTRIKTNFSGLTAKRQTINVAPRYLSFLTKRHEFIFIAEEIKTLILNGTNPKEIAVLIPTNAELARFALYLKHNNISYYVKTLENILQLPLIKQILKVMRYVATEAHNAYSGPELLFEILHLPFFGIEAHSIGLSTVKNAAASTDYRKFLVEQTKENTCELDVKILEVNKILEQLISDVHNYNVYQVFKKLVHTCKVHNYVLKHAERIDLLNQLTTLFDFVEEETSANPDLNTTTFLERLDVLESNKLGIERPRAFGKENGVQLITLHSSKGLEFEHVYIAQCVAKKWEDKSGSGSTFQLPKNVIDSIELAKQGGDEDDNNLHELRRLFYVGMTRAKKYLTISSYEYDNKNKEVKKSTLVGEAFGDIAYNNSCHQNISDEILAQYEPVDRLHEQTEIELKQIEKDLCTKHTENLVLSVSSLNAYLACPLGYYYNKVLKVPTGINEAMSFGSAVHSALELLYKKMLEDVNKAWPSEEEFLKIFETQMWKRRRNFTPKGLKKLSEFGKDIMKLNYEEITKNNTKNCVIEWKPTVDTFYKGIPITGFADRIDFDNKYCTIIDYKTGDPDKDGAKSKLKKPYQMRTGENSIGGDYWRQAVFYKILVDNCSNVDWIVQGCQFVFVEPSKKEGKIVTEPILIDAESESIVGAQIEEVYKKIQAHEFTRGCGDQYCQWCKFAVDNDLAFTDFSNTEEE